MKGIVFRSKTGLDLLGASGPASAGILDVTRVRSLLDFASQTKRFTVLDVPRSDNIALDALDTATKKSCWW